MAGSRMPSGRRLVGCCALAILVAACGGGPSSASPASAAPAPSTASLEAGTPAPSESPVSSDSPVPSDSPDVGSIDKLQPFVPASIWSTCAPAAQLHFPTTVQAAACTYAGVDSVTYELYANAADLKTAFDSIVQGTGAQPSADLAAACAKGNWSGTWSRKGKANVPGSGFECDIDSRGAWIVQADPKVDVLFQANLASGDGAALHAWWLANVSVVEPGT